MFKFLTILKVGLKAIVRNKMRSTLTALGIIIGVACVIAMIGVGQGSQAAIQSQISALGSNFLMVFPGATTQSGARVFTGDSALTEEDVAAIKTEAPSVSYVSPVARASGQIVAGTMNWSTQTQGVGVEWPFIRAWNVDRGAFFGESEVRSAAKVAVLGATVSEALFDAQNPVGETIRIKNFPFRVIGVLERKGGNTTGQDQDDVVIAPYTTVIRLLKGRNRIDVVMASAVSRQSVAQAQSEIDALLRQRHRIPPGGDADFQIRSQQEIAETADETSRTLSVLLASAASISLLVGGIGIMNIMLVSVTERTREIGIRLAIGAKGKDILTQFLIEALTLSVAGGAIGIALGVGASRLLAWKAQWPIQISPAAVMLAFGFSAAIGVFFGFYPARKAARLDPIEALRYE
ncbi:MAG: ABC transporter permease [Thermoanaerobaculia bacterium]